MLYKSYILFLFFILSCSLPIKITKISEKYPDRNNRSYQNKLIIYFPLDEIEYDFLVIARIRLDNDEVYGNLSYDIRMKDYLLNRINGIGADALIYNDELSDSIYTYFDAIYYTRSNEADVFNPIIEDEEESN